MAKKKKSKGLKKKKSPKPKAYFKGLKKKSSNTGLLAYYDSDNSLWGRDIKVQFI